MKRVFMPQTEKSMMGKKLVGVHINKEDAHRLAMLSLEMGVPRTAILLQLINDFLGELPPLSEMIENAAQRAITSFKDDKNNSKNNKNNNKRNKLAFCQETKQDLKSHRIDTEIIDQILKRINA